MKSFLQSITFKSAGNKAELVGEIKGGKELLAEYKYTVSKTKKGQTFTISLDNI